MASVGKSRWQRFNSGMRSRLSFVLVAALALGNLAAQVDRYELGQRLRAFERRLAVESDEARRKAAFAEMDRAVQAFFQMDMGAVAKAIYSADCALAARQPSVAEQYAASLQWSLAARLVAVGDGELKGKLSLAYKIDAEDYEPGQLSLVVHVPESAHRRGKQIVVIPVPEVPVKTSLPLDGLVPGDHVLNWVVLQGDKVLVRRDQPLSVVEDRDERLAKLVTFAKAAKAQAPATIESQTLYALTRMLQVMTRRRAGETILPGAQLLSEAEQLLAWFGKKSGQPFYGTHRAGSFRLRVPVGDRVAALRIYVPEVEQKTPLVIALHGAGGSENLFFDGYGDGRVVTLARERGWMVVAPRLGFGSIDCAALVDVLATRFPVDTDRVVVVGHSMGAMQAVANAVRAPQRYRAVAALGGGGRVGRNSQLEELPFFVGVGTEDFALSGAKSLHGALQRAGASSTLREYADVEHLAIVQVALGDVFEFFQASLGL